MTKSKVKAAGLLKVFWNFFNQVKKISMAQYKVLDPEQEIPCPYNRCEMIRAKRMPYHLIKCRRASRLIYNSEKKYVLFLIILFKSRICVFIFFWYTQE